MRILAVAALVLLFAIGWAVGLWRPPPLPPPLACYFIGEDIEPLPVTVTTQFDTQTVKIMEIFWLCLPATKELPPDKKPAPVQKGDHLTCYQITMRMPPPPMNPTVTDQFDQRRVRVVNIASLCEPADKLPAAYPPESPGGQEQ